MLNILGKEEKWIQKHIRAHLSLSDVHILVFAIFNHLQTHVSPQLVEQLFKQSGGQKKNGTELKATSTDFTHQRVFIGVGEDY